MNFFKILLSALIIGVSVVSCRNNDEQLQQIDQKIHLYIDSLGQDMLNKNISGSYISVSWNDVNGATDNAPVSYTLKKDSDTLNYMQYFAGAKRVLIDSISPENKTYRSTIALNMVLKNTDNTNSTTNDTLVLNYNYTSEYFRVSSAYYNNILVFSKVDGQQNIIKIQK